MNGWNLAYLFRPPWNTGTVPPEVRRLVKEEGFPPGRALDLGCGTGTTVIYLARHGFEAVGVDVAPRAVAKARRTAQEAGVSPAFYVGDVTRLGTAGDLPVQGPFDLVVDVGCFHSLRPPQRHQYALSLARLTRPGTLFLLYAFRPLVKWFVRSLGVDPPEVEATFTPTFRLLRREDGRGSPPSAWYWLERR